MSLLTLAAEATPKGLWYPTILGVLVVVAGIVLFCGSIYVLLGTNLGARLGFLVAFTGARRVHGASSPCCGAPPRRRSTR